jgi:hypothetical protein
MNLKRLWIALVLVCVSAPAKAATIAGWDFSQWLGSGILSTDNVNLRDTLDANYSSLDPTNNAGAESALLGRLFFNGQFGSTAVNPDPASAIFAPVGGSLNGNLDAPTLDLLGNPIPGTNPFDSLGILSSPSEGQQYANRLSMAATAPLDVVFAANPGSLGALASDWRVTFGGRADSASPLAILFSTDGLNYTPAGNVSLGAADTRYSVNLSTAPGERAFVLFRFAPGTDNAQFIDNVAIEGALPEPATLGLLLASLVGLVAARARRT